MIRSRRDSLRAVAIPAALLVTVLAIATTVGQSRSFLTSLVVVTDSALPLIPLVLGTALIITIGEIDLSVAGGYSFYGMLMLWGAQNGLPLLTTIGIVLCAAILSGVALSALVLSGRTSSLIASLGVSIVLAGLAVLLDSDLRVAAHGTGSIGASGGIGASRVLPLSYRPSYLSAAAYFMVPVIVAAAMLWRRTWYGMAHLAIGTDRPAARLAGLPVTTVQAGSFVTGSLLCAMASILAITGYQRGGWNPTAGAGVELMAIAASVIGGTRITGGRLEPLAVVAAVMLWQGLHHLRFALPFVGAEMQLLASGLILLAVAVSNNK